MTKSSVLAYILIEWNTSTYFEIDFFTIGGFFTNYGLYDSDTFISSREDRVIVWWLDYEKEGLYITGNNYC